ncbi:MAG: DNA primase [Rhodocyclaceae bacterium]|nr:DNA primase [Rhodocyclaceae bacterium]
MIPDSFIQELLARIDIVEVVERHVPLRKAGINYSACCPFHSEKTPSFTVSHSKQFYHCFGCGAHGSAIGFLMQYVGIGFIDAVEELAHSIGLSVPQVSERLHAERAKKAPLTDIMALAAQFYKNQLKISPKAIEYLKGRGLTGEIAAKFGLGYAPDAWQGLQNAFPGYEKETALTECGLVICNDQGRRYDRFRDRIMFPILDQRSNVIGFGGRILDQGEPKYLNSPETPLFEKGRELYGLTQARSSIRETDTVIVVEGYMDVVALAQHGISNAVATLGTATTPTHLQKLLRQAGKVVFCFDGDAAGRKAAWRAADMSLEQVADDKSIGFIFLPTEHDPDSFVRAEGAEAFRRLVAQPLLLSDYLLQMMRSRVDLSTHEGRAGLISEVKPLLQRLAAPLLRVQLTKAIAEAAALTQAETEAACGLKPLARGRRGLPRQTRRLEISTHRTLLRAVIMQPARAARIPLERISHDSQESATLHAIVNDVTQGKLPTRSNAGHLDEFYRDTPHQRLIADVVLTLPEIGENEDSLEQEFNDAINSISRDEITQSIRAETAAAQTRPFTTADAQRLKELLSKKNSAKNRV